MGSVSRQCAGHAPVVGENRCGVCAGGAMVCLIELLLLRGAETPIVATFAVTSTLFLWVN